MTLALLLPSAQARAESEQVGGTFHFGSGLLIQTIVGSGELTTAMEEDSLFKPEQRETGRSARRNRPKPVRKPRKKNVNQSTESSASDGSFDEGFLEEGESTEAMLEDTGKTPEPAPEPRREKLDLSWKIGYAFNYLSFPESATAPAMSELGHSFAAGLNWTGYPRLNLGASVLTEYLPDSGYHHSAVQAHLGYLFYTVYPGVLSEEELRGRTARAPLERTGYFAEENVEVSGRGEWVQRRKINPEAYFAREHSDWYDQVEVDPRHFPNFYLGLNIGGHGHTKAEGTYTRANSDIVLAEEQLLTQTMIGPEAIYSPGPGVRFRVSGLVYVYDQELDDFLDTFEQGRGLAFPSFSLAQFAGFALPGPVFPSITADQSVSWDVAEYWTLRFNLNQTGYRSAGQSMTWAASPSFVHDVSERWVLNGGLELIVGGTTGFAGALGATYLF